MPYDETDALISACKGEPYTVQEWTDEVVRLREELDDALVRLGRARYDGVCLAARFDERTAA